MKYYIGIDGGGTKTAVRLANENKETVADVVTTGSNPSYVGVENALTTIEQAVAEVCKKGGVDFSEIHRVFGGIAGCVTHNFSPECKELLGKLLPNAKIDIINDSMLLFVDLTGDEGAVMICGTGSICFVLKDKKLSRVGGYGTLDGGGSGYEIGKAAIEYALKASDGRRERTLLCELIDKHNGVDIVKATAELTLDEIRGLGKYCPLVFEACRGGDTVAKGILEDCFAFLREYVEVAARRFDGEFELVVGGGVFRDDLAFEMFQTDLPEGVKLIRAGEPVDCAVRSAIFGNVAPSIIG